MCTRTEVKRQNFASIQIMFDNNLKEEYYPTVLGSKSLNHHFK